MAAITFQCFACNQVLQVEAANAGRKAKCSQCGTILTIPVTGADAVVEGVAAPMPSAPAPAQLPRTAARNETSDDRGRRDEFDDRPRRRDDWDDDRPRRRYADDYDDYDVGRPATPNWDRVKVGMLLAFIGLCVMAGGFGLSFLGNLVGFVSIDGWSVFARLGTTVSFLGTIVAVVGHVFWLFVLSNKRGALGFAIAALSVAGVYTMVQLLLLLPLFGGFWGMARGTSLIAHLLRAAHFMMIAFYLKALAQTLRDGRLEHSAGVNIILSGCLAGVDLFVSILWMAILPIGSVLNLLGGIFVIVVFIFTLLAVHRGRLLLAHHTRARDSRRW